MFGNLSGPTLLVILFIVLLLFGAPKLPALARSLGQSMKILKKEVSSDAEKGDADKASTVTAGEGAPEKANGVSLAPQVTVADPADELAAAKAEAAAAKAEAEALRAAAEKKNGS